MASAYLRTENVPVILPKNFAQAAALMAQFDRATIASTIEVLVNLLDVLEDDPDLERTEAEDDFVNRPQRPWHGPGCEISDPSEDDDHAGGNIDDEPHDPQGDYDSGDPIRGGGSGEC